MRKESERVTERELRESIRERKQEARRMRRTLAEWIAEGCPARKLNREYDRLRAFEKDTEAMEDMLTDESRPAGMLQIGFVREEEGA